MRLWDWSFSYASTSSEIIFFVIFEMCSEVGVLTSVWMTRFFGSFQFRSSKRIDPLQAGEAIEVAVCAIDYSGVFAGVKGDERVRAQIASHSGVFEQ